MMEIKEEKTIIRPFRKNDFEKVTDIFIDAFKSKLDHLIKLDDERVREFLVDSNFIENKPIEGYFVAEKDGEVLGILLLKWKEQNRIKITNKTGFLYLVKKYGFFRTIRTILGALFFYKRVAENECYIEHIAVSKNARGLGIGTKLLEYGENVAQNEIKKKRYTLYVALSNKAAKRLYERVGFEDIELKSSLLSTMIIKEGKWYFMEKKL